MVFSGQRLVGKLCPCQDLGFGEKPAVTYVDQIIPPPYRANVKKGAKIADIVLTSDRCLAEPMVADSERLASEKYQQCHLVIISILGNGSGKLMRRRRTRGPE